MTTADEERLEVRRLKETDLSRIVQIDAAHTGVRKDEHWRELLVNRRGRERLALVAELSGWVVGYVVGEIRAWEFGSPPTGWIYAIGVDQTARRRGVGTALLRAARAAFAERGLGVTRTMVRKQDVELLRFFRSDGYSAGPFVELEAAL
jgi:ribosomal protein S18 acetylase RimI-like enzyme